MHPTSVSIWSTPVDRSVSFVAIVASSILSVVVPLSSL